MTDETEDRDWCCDDDWSVWLRFETWIWAVLLLVQMSMVVFFVIHGRKDTSFRQAFYVFFVAVTIADCALVILRPSRGGYDTMFGTHYDDGFTEEKNWKTNESVYFPTVRAWISDLTSYVVVPIFGHAQPLFLTAIAVNRFTAFALPLKHASMWRTRTVVVVTVALGATSVILGVGYRVYIMVRQGTTCWTGTRKQQADLHCDCAAWGFRLVEPPLAFLAFSSTICCVVSFVLNVGSVGALFVLRTNGRLQRKSPELPLFVHSLYLFVLQAFLAFQDLVYVMDNADIFLWSLDIKGSAWAHLRHSSEWLAGTKATRRRVDGELQLIPGCKTSKYHWPDERPPLPICSAWYSFLIGDLTLREDYTDFTVRLVVQSLLALSGSVSLLIISANVRNAYFKCFVRCKCLKNRQRVGVDVTAVHTEPAFSLSIGSRGI